MSPATVATAMSLATNPARHSQLIDPDELDSRLEDPNLRIIDCDMQFAANADGNYTISSGLPNWREAHVPNSVYVDIGESLSAPHPRSDYRLSMEAG